MERQDKVYYKRSWFTNRNDSLINLLFNIKTTDDNDSLLNNAKAKHESLEPGLFGIYIMNDLTLLILIFLVAKSHNTLGCKTLFLSKDTKYWYYSQLSLFLVAYFIISIPYAESLENRGIAIPPIWTLFLSFVVWLITNAMARLGETFVFAAYYNPFLWPSPFDWYGFLGICLTILYVISEYYNYYYAKLPNAQITILLEYVLLLSYVYISSTIIYIFSKNFYNKVIIGNESITQFFFKLDSTDCNKNNKLYKKFDQEIKAMSK